MVQINETVFFNVLGTTYKVLSNTVNGSLAIVEHTLEAKSLGAPMHKHSYEDETSYVLEGKLSVIQNGKVEMAGPGEYIIKPRGIFHTFWNTTNERIRFIEIISPGAFEMYFAEMAPFFTKGKPLESDKMKAIAEKYGLITDPYAGEEIIKQYGLNPLR